MSKRNKVRVGIIFGILMAISSIVFGLLTESNLTREHISIIFIQALIGGCIQGVLFGSVAGWFGNSKSIMKGTEIRLEENETILFEAPANHFKSIEAVGGKLYLTNSRLVFQSHKFNFQNHQLSIPLSNIAKVNRYRALGIANTGLSVTTADNTIDKFVVQQREEWMKILQNQNIVV